MNQTVECIGCAHQCRPADTDSGHCPECGGETMDLASIYGPDGLHPDPDFKEPS